MASCLALPLGFSWEAACDKGPPEDAHEGQCGSSIHIRFLLPFGQDVSLMGLCRTPISFERQMSIGAQGQDFEFLGIYALIFLERTKLSLVFNSMTKLGLSQDQESLIGLYLRKYR